MASKYLFSTASTRKCGLPGNTEWLAEQAAKQVPSRAPATWQHLARLITATASAT